MAFVWNFQFQSAECLDPSSEDFAKRAADQALLSRMHDLGSLMFPSCFRCVPPKHPTDRDACRPFQRGVRSPQPGPSEGSPAERSSCIGVAVIEASCANLGVRGLLVSAVDDQMSVALDQAAKAKAAKV